MGQLAVSPRFVSNLQTPEAWGTTGNGVTDDYAALVRAMTAAGVNGIVRGDPSKTYLISTPLVLSTAGQRWEDVNIKAAASITAVAATAIVSITGAGVTWLRGSVDANGTNQTVTTRSIGINAADVTVDGASIVNARHYGITASNQSRYKIRNNSITTLVPVPASGNSIAIWAENTLGVSTTEGGEISGNRIDFSDQDAGTTKAVGIIAWGASGHITDGVSVKNNWIKHVVSPTETTTVIMDVRYLRGATISGNECYNGRIGITVGTGCIECSITGNTGKDQTYAPFEAGDCTYCTFSGNTGYCNGLANYGFACDGPVGFDHITITGNTIFGALLNAMFMSGSGITASDITISGNTLQNDAASITAVVSIFRMTSGVFVDGNNLIGGDSSNTGSVGVLLTRGTGHTVGLNNISRCNKGVRLLSDSGDMTDTNVKQQHFVGGITTDYELAVTSGTFGTGVKLPDGVLYQSNARNRITGSNGATTAFQQVGSTFTLKGHRWRSGETLRISVCCSGTGTNTKTYTVRLGTSTDVLAIATGNTSGEYTINIRSLTASTQTAHASNITGFGSSSAAPGDLSIDQTADLTIKMGVALNAAANTALEVAGFDGITVEILRDPN